MEGARVARVCSLGGLVAVVPGYVAGPLAQRLLRDAERRAAAWDLESAQRDLKRASRVIVPASVLRGPCASPAPRLPAHYPVLAAETAVHLRDRQRSFWGSTRPTYISPERISKECIAQVKPSITLPCRAAPCSILRPASSPPSTQAPRFRIRSTWSIQVQPTIGRCIQKARKSCEHNPEVLSPPQSRIHLVVLETDWADRKAKICIGLRQNYIK